MHARLKGGGFAALVILAGLTQAATSEAAPLLLLDIEGFIPTLTVTHTTEVIDNGSSGPVSTTETFTNVPFSAHFTLDGAKWALTQNTGGPGFPLQVFSDIDPSAVQTGPTDPGIQTEEWLRGQMTLDLGGGLSFGLNRDFVFARPANQIVAPSFSGEQRIGYLEGSETIPVLGFDFGDTFQMRTSGGFGYFSPTALPVGGVVSRGQSWFFSLSIHELYDAQGNLRELFGPGAPFAFLWQDALPTSCTPTFGPDCFPEASFLSFQFFDLTGVMLSDTAFELRTTLYDGDPIATRVTLTPAVPEPATLVTALTGLIALGLKRRRHRTSRT